MNDQMSLKLRVQNTQENIFDRMKKIVREKKMMQIRKKGRRTTKQKDE